MYFSLFLNESGLNGAKPGHSLVSSNSSIKYKYIKYFFSLHVKQHTLLCTNHLAIDAGKKRPINNS